jgi:hypothetical protein
MSLVMYPNMDNRREFVHDSYLIAKVVENDELTKSIIRDPYFYLTSQDLHKLMKTNDYESI